MDNELPFDPTSKDDVGFHFSIKPDEPIVSLDFYKSGYSCGRFAFKYDDKKQDSVEDAIEFFNPTKYPDIEEPKIQLSIPDRELPPDYDKEIYSDLNNLYDASYATQKNVGFKASIQHMEINRLKRVTDLSDSLRDGTFNFQQPKEFTLNERGHIRDIKAQAVNDRIVLHSYNDNILVPKTEPYLIYDNGASIKNKGVDFTRRRFKEHLIWAHNHYHGNFYILFIDFSKFFDNLVHAKIIEYFSTILDPVELQFFQQCLQMFEVDISYLEEEEVVPYFNSIFNSLEYSNLRKETQKSNPDYNKLYNKSRMMKKSVDIGNHLSQMIGVYYPHEIDNYCKTIRQIHCYDRYMDDIAIMLPTKKECKDICIDIKQISDRVGLHMNMRKTRIINPYKGPSTFLKINYFIKPTGKIIERIHSDTIHRERRRILKYIKLVEHNKISAEDFFACYRSWRGTFWKYDSKYDILNIDKFLEENLTEELKGYIMKHITTYDISKPLISQYLNQI